MATIDEIREDIQRTQLKEGLNWVYVHDSIPRLQLSFASAVDLARYIKEHEEELHKFKFHSLLDGKDYTVDEMLLKGVLPTDGESKAVGKAFYKMVSLSRDEDERKKRLRKCIFTLTQLEENPHNLMRSLGNKEQETWYLMLIRNQSKELLDLSCIDNEIYDEIIDLSNKIESKLSMGESPYIETEQILALCKSQIPSKIVDVYGQVEASTPACGVFAQGDVSDKIKAFNEDPYR